MATTDSCSPGAADGVVRTRPGRRRGGDDRLAASADLCSPEDFSRSPKALIEMVDCLLVTADPQEGCGIQSEGIQTTSTTRTSVGSSFARSSRDAGKQAGTRGNRR